MRLLLLLVLALQARQVEAPPLTIVHSAGLEREANRIADQSAAILERIQGRLGAPPLPPTRVYLAADDGSVESLLGEAGFPPNLMPGWAAGIALPAADTMVLHAGRIGRYGQRQLIGVFAHETVHLLMAHAAGGPLVGDSRLPSWFSEGVAANLARDGEWMDFFVLYTSPVASSRRPLAELESCFRSPAVERLRRAAYAGSYSFVKFLMDRHGPGLPARVLAGLRAGMGFEAAYHRAAGIPLAVDEAAWFSLIHGKLRWAVILGSSFTLWMAITALVLLAYLRKKRRARLKMEAWQEDEPF